MKVKEYREHLDSTLKSLNRQDFWEKAYIASLQGPLSHAPATPAQMSSAAAQDAAAMAAEWEKRR